MRRSLDTRYTDQNGGDYYAIGSEDTLAVGPQLGTFLVKPGQSRTGWVPLSTGPKDTVVQVQWQGDRDVDTGNGYPTTVEVSWNVGTK